MQCEEFFLYYKISLTIGQNQKFNQKSGLSFLFNVNLTNCGQAVSVCLSHHSAEKYSINYMRIKFSECINKLILSLESIHSYFDLRASKHICELSHWSVAYQPIRYVKKILPVLIIHPLVSFKYLNKLQLSKISINTTQTRIIIYLYELRK